MSRGKAYNRHISKTKALRKKKIAETVYHMCSPYYDNLHQFSKNKIHCSCPLCNQKTNLKKHGKYRSMGAWSGFSNKGKHYTHMDIQRIYSMRDEMEEYPSQVEGDALLTR